MALIDIIKRAAIRCNIPTPSAAFSATDPLIIQMVAFANDAAQDMIERWDWRNLKIGAQVIGDGTTTLFSLPADWLRVDPSDKSPVGAFVSNLFPLIPLSGPVNDEDLNAYKNFPAMPVRPMWRLIGGALEIWPALALNETVTFNYFSKNFVIKSDGSSRQPQWTADDDVGLVPEDTIMKGVVWRWKNAKGLDYAEEMRQYELSLIRQAGQESQERSVATAFPSYYPGMDWWPGAINDQTTQQP
jgi:hypothetical protein